MSAPLRRTYIGKDPAPINEITIIEHWSYRDVSLKIADSKQINAIQHFLLEHGHAALKEESRLKMTFEKSSHQEIMSLATDLYREKYIDEKLFSQLIESMKKSEAIDKFFSPLLKHTHSIFRPSIDGRTHSGQGEMLSHFRSYHRHH